LGLIYALITGHLYDTKSFIKQMSLHCIRSTQLLRYSCTATYMFHVYVVFNNKSSSKFLSFTA
jgi:hypothetical protein